MEHVVSADGTPIAVERTGTGPALVFVMGALCDRTTTASLAALLTDRFTVYEYDRRGRGDSADTAPYAVEREVEDLAAVITAAGGSAYVYGHSSGAALALEAAAAGVPIAKLAVFEPPYTGEEVEDGSGTMLSRIDGALADGDRDLAAHFFMQGVGTPDPVITMMKAGPGWGRMRDLAPTLPYDLILSARGDALLPSLASVTIPALAMAGGASLPWAVPGAEKIAATVPNGRALRLPGQSHGPADDVVAAALGEFFVEGDV
ncbi:MAG TPA: alpha/beta hydrolase [Actinopolymorphaceae bacterium]|jgi:pimeloyl-ACP methyl ester carboxylesterase